MSRYDEDTIRVIKKAQGQGYTSVNIDYDGPRIGQKAKGYTVSAKRDGVRVTIGIGSSWDKCYRDAMDYLMASEGINNLSTIDWEAENYFSWKNCDVCGRPLGGDRIDCNGYNPITKEVQGPYSVCMDCHYYAEYGQLDDMTMQEMEE